MVKEFKQFIARGNVIDLAVGIIIGSAFGKIVSSIVDDIIMPIIGIIIGGVDFSNLNIRFNDAVINYGAFIQSTIDFLIIALCIFILIKFINRLVPKIEEEKKKEENTILLEEIRDLLKKKNPKL